MSTPSRQEIEVATGALRREAATWTDQADEFGTIISNADSLRLDRVEAGLFQLIFDTYRQVVDQVVTRSREGQRQMADIGATLRRVADTYDREEEANLHRIRGIY